jgi:succinate-semialdehyde dehydrogenase / glutarate-semialdehyde dehydrogenase
MSLPGFTHVPADLFVGGAWRPATGDERFAVEDPATGETLVEVASAAVDDARAAVAAAHEAGPGWAATAPRERAEVLRRAFELMTAQVDDLARLIVRENGKSLTDARGEAAYAAEFFRWFSEEAVRIDGGLMTAPSGRNRILVLRQPVGVAVLVTPWNFPAAMATRKIGPALAAGCTVVLKPASYTPLTALAIGDILSQAGAPPGTVNVLPARRSGEVVGAMLDDDRVRKLSFTGSTEVGSVLLKKAAERIVSCSMELGGNAPFLVFDDADLDAAIDGALVAKMRNGGASCIAANRFLVQEPVAEEFARRLAEALGGLRVGPGLEPDTDLGPMVSEQERDNIAELVEQGVSGGAKVLCGGAVPDEPGWYYPPTVLAGVEPGNQLVAEEVFGPVAPVMAFGTTDDALALANDTPYGLAAYVFTRDLSRGLAVSEALETGMVGLNRGFISDPAAPFGGVKQSGLGREGGHDGLLEFCESKYIAADW